MYLSLNLRVFELLHTDEMHEPMCSLCFYLWKVHYLKIEGKVIFKIILKSSKKHYTTLTLGVITVCIVIYVFVYFIISTTCFSAILRSYDNITRKHFTAVQNLLLNQLYLMISF